MKYAIHNFSKEAQRAQRVEREHTVRARHRRCVPVQKIIHLV